MNTAPLLYIIAGESSGDQIGARLIKALKQQGTFRIEGIGGPAMVEQGMQSLFPMQELSIMGIVEVIPHIPNVFKRLKQTEHDILTKKPAAVITIDSPGFCFRLAKRLHKHHIPLIHYTAPSVWAWRPGRAKKIAKFLDALLTLFPHEPPYFLKEGLATTFVGHPLIEMDITPARGQGFRQRHDIDEHIPLLCLLAGSRRSEVDHLLPIFAQVIEKLKIELPNLKIVMPVVPHLEAYLQKSFKSLIENPVFLIISDPQKKISAMAASNFALAASGTVALELALTETPMVIAYKINRLTAWIVRSLIITPYACLINILLKDRVVPELIQENCTVEKITAALMAELQGQQIVSLRQIRALISPLQGKPSDIAASQIIELIHKNNS